MVGYGLLAQPWKRESGSAMDRLLALSRSKEILTRKKQSKLWKEEPKMIEWIPNKELPYWSQWWRSQTSWWRLPQGELVKFGIGKLDMWHFKSLQFRVCTLFSIFLRTTEQAQAYLKIWVLVSDWTYIFPSLFECAQNNFFHVFVIFKHPWYPTASSLNMPLYPSLLLIVVDTGSFWIQGHCTEQSTHCAMRRKVANIGDTQ